MASQPHGSVDKELLELHRERQRSIARISQLLHFIHALSANTSGDAGNAVALDADLQFLVSGTLSTRILVAQESHNRNLVEQEALRTHRTLLDVLSTEARRHSFFSAKGDVGQESAPSSGRGATQPHRSRALGAAEYAEALRRICLDERRCRVSTEAECADRLRIAVAQSAAQSALIAMASTAVAAPASSVVSAVAYRDDGEEKVIVANCEEQARRTTEELPSCSVLEEIQGNSAVASSSCLLVDASREAPVGNVVDASTVGTDEEASGNMSESTCTKQPATPVCVAPRRLLSLPDKRPLQRGASYHGRLQNMQQLAASEERKLLCEHEGTARCMLEQWMVQDLETQQSEVRERVKLETAARHSFLNLSHGIAKDCIAHIELLQATQLDDSRGAAFTAAEFDSQTRRRDRVMFFASMLQRAIDSGRSLALRPNEVRLMDVLVSSAPAQFRVLFSADKTRAQTKECLRELIREPRRPTIAERVHRFDAIRCHRLRVEAAAANGFSKVLPQPCVCKNIPATTNE